AIARLGTPSQTQAEWAANIRANQAYSQGTTPPATTGVGAGTAVASPSGAPGVALGVRQDNPLNLEVAWQPGASPTQGNRFGTYPDMPTGIAATADQIVRNQQLHGANTVNDMVDRWVSDPKADLRTYKQDIANALGVGINDRVDFSDPNVQTK